MHESMSGDHAAIDMFGLKAVALGPQEGAATVSRCLPKTIVRQDGHTTGHAPAVLGE